MNIKYMHKKFFQVKCGNIIKYRSNARNKNIYKCRMQRNMNKYRSNEYRQNIGEDNISIPLKNAGALTKSCREREWMSVQKVTNQ